MLLIIQCVTACRMWWSKPHCDIFSLSKVTVQNSGCNDMSSCPSSGGIALPTAWEGVMCWPCAPGDTSPGTTYHTALVSMHSSKWATFRWILPRSGFVKFELCIHSQLVEVWLLYMLRIKSLWNTCVITQTCSLIYHCGSPSKHNVIKAFFVLLQIEKHICLSLVILVKSGSFCYAAFLVTGVAEQSALFLSKAW